VKEESRGNILKKHTRKAKKSLSGGYTGRGRGKRGIVLLDLDSLRIRGGMAPKFRRGGSERGLRKSMVRENEGRGPQRREMGKSKTINSGYTGDGVSSSFQEG